MTTHAGPTVGDALDQGVPSTAHGWQADVHVTAVDGGDVSVVIQDSADGKTWTGLQGGASETFDAAGAQRLIGGPTAVVRRYLRASTKGSFTAATFVASFIRHEAPQDGVGPLFEPRIRHAPTPEEPAEPADAPKPVSRR